MSLYEIMQYVRRLFEKFLDSPYYSELELCGGAVTVSFSRYLPCQAMHFLQRSIHFPKTCCRPLITSKFLASELPFHNWKSPEIAWDEIWTLWRMFFWDSTDPIFIEFISYLAPCDFLAFPTMKKELRGKKFRSDERSAARFREVGGAL
jgi:hypothetical protein